MPKAQSTQRDETRIGLVLAGGAARGAYEVGVLHHIVRHVGHDLGRPVPLDIICGTSVGAINACALAAFADEPIGRVDRLVRHWTSLRLQDLVQPSGREMLALARELLVSPPARNGRAQGGLLDPRGLQCLLSRMLPFERIEDHLRTGRLHALSVSATHVATGFTVVFVQTNDPALPPWKLDPTVVARRTRIRQAHALASSAIPLLFPAVQVEGGYYCDGGLRQNVPLSPARRLGASGLVVISPRRLPEDPAAEIARAQADAAPGSLFVIGKALNALLLDRVDADLDRLSRMNAILEAGCRSYGPGFIDRLNRELGRSPERAFRPLATVLIRASQDIARLSAEYARTPLFRRRMRGLLGRVAARLAEGESAREADLLSYLLFDGEFARILIELGEADAQARHEELCRFFTSLVQPQTQLAVS